MSEPIEPTSGNGEAVKDEPIVDPSMGEGAKESDELSALKQTIIDMQERQQQQSALIGKLNNALKREAEPEPKKEQDKAKGNVENYSELREQIEQLQEKNKKQERAAKLNAIELALVEAGAVPSLAKNQAEFYAFKLGDSIRVDDSSVTVADGEGEVVITDWAKAFIESDSGSYLRAQKVGPSVRNDGGHSGPTSKTKLTSSKYSAEYANAHAKGPDVLASFVASHELDLGVKK